MLEKYKNPDLGLLLIRLGLGIIFIAHGWQKFGAMDGTIAFFGSLGLPAVVAYLISTIELLGGIALVLGIYTQWAGLLIALLMVGAIYLVKFKMGLIGGYELDLGLLIAALNIFFTGPGKYTVQSWMKK